MISYGYVYRYGHNCNAVFVVVVVMFGVDSQEGLSVVVVQYIFQVLLKYLYFSHMFTSSESSYLPL